MPRRTNVTNAGSSARMVGALNGRTKVKLGVAHIGHLRPFVVLAFNRLGDGLRDALDLKMAGTE